MEEILILLLILFLAFGLTGEDIPLDIVPEEEPEIEREDITGREIVNVKEEGNIHREFQGQIAGNTSVEVESSRGNIFIRFTDKIAGTARVNIRAEQGDIYVGIEDEITGNASVNIVSNQGDVTFVGDRNKIEGFISRNNLEVSAGGNINYRTGTIFDLMRTSPKFSRGHRFSLPDLKTI